MSAHGERVTWFYGDEAECPSDQPAPARVHRLILLGAPGSGKGTQAALLVERLGACHLAMGDVFRAARDLPEEERPPAMRSAVEYMNRGELVPDDTVIDLIRDRSKCLTCEQGFLLDGFPRTVKQAQALDELLAEHGVDLSGVLYYDIAEEEIIRRISGRLTCRQCKAVFHEETSPPATPGVCDRCGGELYRRTDDEPESVKTRLGAYEASTAPLVEYYEKRGLLYTIPATGAAETIFARTCDVLGI